MSIKHKVDMLCRKCDTRDRSQSLQNSVFEFSTNPLEVSEDITAAHTESSSYISIKTFQKSDSGKYARTN